MKKGTFILFFLVKIIEKEGKERKKEGKNYLKG